MTPKEFTKSNTSTSAITQVFSGQLWLAFCGVKGMLPENVQLQTGLPGSLHGPLKCTFKIRMFIKHRNFSLKAATKLLRGRVVAAVEMPSPGAPSCGAWPPGRAPCYPQPRGSGPPHRPRWGVYNSRMGTPHWGVCSGEGSPHGRVYTPQWEVPTRECTLPNGFGMGSNHHEV